MRERQTFLRLESGALQLPIKRLPFKEEDLNKEIEISEAQMIALNLITQAAGDF